jgi:hypothetical protein
LFDELAAVGRPLSLEDFNLYIFRGLHGEFKDLVTSLVTKTESLSYVDFTTIFLLMSFYIRLIFHHCKSTFAAHTISVALCSPCPVAAQL